jgi:hypothetical protein
MDHEVMVPQPLAAVFGHLAAPSLLAGWLPEVAGVRAGAGQPTGIGATFGLRLRHGDRDISGSGELIGYEPPWSVAYRLVAGPHTHVLRLTCVSSGDGTRVCVHQADGAVPLAVDLGPLPGLISVAAADPQAAGGDPCGSRS